MSPQTREDLLLLLQWTLEIGADEIVDDTAHNWMSGDKALPDFALPLSISSKSTQNTGSVTQQASIAANPPHFEQQKSSTLKGNFKRASAPSSYVSLEAATQSARERVLYVKTLEELKNALNEFEGCSLKKTAKNLCYFRGSAKANLMIIGEAPGRDEDIQGSPFVGRAGQLLDRMLAAIGLEEKDVHITNVVYWRPPGNRTPTSQETESCRPFLEKQISLVSPRILLLLGTSAAKQILDKDDGILRLRGRWFETNIEGCKIPTLASLHPAYLLRTPSAKKFAWRDLLLVKQELSKIKAL